MSTACRLPRPVTLQPPDNATPSIRKHHHSHEQEEQHAVHSQQTVQAARPTAGQRGMGPLHQPNTPDSVPGTQRPGPGTTHAVHRVLRLSLQRERPWRSPR